MTRLEMKSATGNANRQSVARLPRRLTTKLLAALAILHKAVPKKAAVAWTQFVATISQLEDDSTSARTPRRCCGS